MSNDGDRRLPRVLVLHNRYRSEGGEERAAEELAGLLRERGHAVELLQRRSGELAGASGRLRGGAAMLRGGVDPGEVGDAVRELGADIVHAHNTVPLLGPRALEAAREAGARVVMHLHNYRLVCAIGIAYRDGAPCTRCHGRRTWPGARLRCRGNLAEAMTYAAGIAIQQPRLLEAVDRFIVTTHGSERVLAELGLQLPDHDVIGNFLPDSAFAERSGAESGGYALYAGRLAEEKGVDTAIEAARRSGVPLAIAGAGPDEPRLRRLAGAGGRDVRFLGRLDASRAGGGAGRRRDGRRSLALARAASLRGRRGDGGGAAGPRLPGRRAGRDGGRGRNHRARRRRRLGAGRWSGCGATRSCAASDGDAALARARERFAADLYYERLMACYRTALADRGADEASRSRAASCSRCASRSPTTRARCAGSRR